MTGAQDSVTLLPCPFCGGPARLWTPAMRRYPDMHGACREPACDQCGAALGFYDDAAKAVAAWNTRHREAAQAELVERCALIAEESRDGRLMQKANANAQNDKRAARDFESMAIEAGLIAAEIRARSTLSKIKGGEA